MANQRTTRTQTQLQDDSRILAYEFRNLFGAARNLARDHVKSDTIANNAHVESFAVHCRALILFFYGQQHQTLPSVPPRDTDVLADDFFVTPDTWQNHCPDCSQALKDAKRQADKQVTHMTVDRRGLNQPDGTTAHWEIGAVLQELCDIAESFVTNVPSGNLTSRVDTELRTLISEMRPTPLAQPPRPAQTETPSGPTLHGGSAPLPADTRMPLTSADVLGDRTERLRDLIPEAFVEGKIDFDRLKAALGDLVDESRERYGLSWAGKADAIRAIQAPSVGTLVPCPEESVNFDTTENLFIEGDNLEVLKLLQKSYYGKVKMIYIDPPYNTGNEFIYPDNFREGLDEYLKYSGQVGEEGVRLSTNTETSGRFHSKWLGMMYPRLFLARNLLSNNGAIFVSIDDHEVNNLRLLMDEVFGAENFIASVIWQRVYSPKNTAKYFSEDHDYVLVYARHAETWRPELLPRTEEANARYDNPDNDPRGPWKSSDMTARNFYSQGQYEATSPSGKIFKPSRGRYWGTSPDGFAKLDQDNRIWWGPDGDSMPAQKRFLSEVKQGLVPQTLWKYEDVGHTQEAKKELLKYVHFEDTENVLNSVKPPRLIQRMLQTATRPADNDIVLDFFAGSAATGHAIYKQNLEDGGNRRFILAQLPEPLPKPEEGLSTIFDMGAARLRNVTNEITTGEDGKLDGVSSTDLLPQLGFRKLKLTQSNFKIWDGDDAPVDADALAGQLKLFADHVLPDRSEQDILYELMLKAGLPLTAKIEEKDATGQTAYSIADGLLLICLADPITQDCLRAMIELQPERVICLDPAFGGNDQLKTNTVLEMKSHGIEFRTV